MRGFDGRLQDPWHALAPAAPYTNGAVDLAARIDGEGNVHLRGEIVRNAAASGDLLYTIPDTNYRPKVTTRLLVPCAPLGAIGQVAIFTNGEIRLYVIAGTPTNYYLNCTYTAL